MHFANNPTYPLKSNNKNVSVFSNISTEVTGCVYFKWQIHVRYSQESNLSVELENQTRKITITVFSCKPWKTIEFFLNNTNLTFLAFLYKIDIDTLQEHQKFRTETEISLISDTIYNYFWSTILAYQLEYVACIVCVFNITTHYLQPFYVPSKR